MKISNESTEEVNLGGVGGGGGIVEVSWARKEA